MQYIRVYVTSYVDSLCLIYYYYYSVAMTPCSFYILVFPQLVEKLAVMSSDSSCGQLGLSVYVKGSEQSLLAVWLC